MIHVRVCVVKMKSLVLESDAQGWRQGTRGAGMLVSTPVTKPITRCHQSPTMQKNFAIRGQGRRAALLSQARCAWPRHTVPSPFRHRWAQPCRASRGLSKHPFSDRTVQNKQRSIKPFNPANPVVSDASVSQCVDGRVEVVDRPSLRTAAGR